MRLLIIGSSGRLGGAFRRRLAATHELIMPGSKELDLLNETSVADAIARFRPDWIVNAAAYNNVDGAEGEGAVTAMRVNAHGPGILAGAAARHHVPLLHFSTDYVFAGDRQDGYGEEDTPAPISAYGMSKYLGELAVRALHPRAAIVRTSRLYGPPAEGQGSKPSFVEIVFDLAARGPEFSINNGEVSAPTFVDDLVDHVQTHLLSSASLPGIYHMANAGGCTWYEWAKAIVEDASLEVKVTPRDPKELSRPARRPEFSVLRSTKLPAMRPWREALRAYLRSK